MKKYRCVVCEWIYDPAVGDPDGGIAPGTPFEEIPDDWACPVCGVDKSNFEEVFKMFIFHENNLCFMLLSGIFFVSLQIGRAHV